MAKQKTLAWNIHVCQTIVVGYNIKTNTDTVKNECQLHLPSSGCLQIQWTSAFLAAAPRNKECIQLLYSWKVMDNMMQKQQILL